MKIKRLQYFRLNSLVKYGHISTIYSKYFRNLVKETWLFTSCASFLPTLLNYWKTLDGTGESHEILKEEELTSPSNWTIAQAANHGTVNATQ